MIDLDSVRAASSSSHVGWNAAWQAAPSRQHSRIAAPHDRRKATPKKPSSGPPASLGNGYRGGSKRADLRSKAAAIKLITDGARIRMRWNPAPIGEGEK